MTIEAIPRPAGKSTDYQFFYNKTTGNRFKVKVSATEAAPVRLNESDAANTQFGVCITTSLIDDDGRALQESGLPIVDSWTHTFTDVETSEPEFSVQARIAAILTDRIGSLEARHTARASLSDIQKAWTADPINLKGE
jgi:hypothetical protein